jgi:hypothetical protein
MSGLTRDAILNADDLPRVEVVIPEWKGSVYVRALNGAERDALERMLSSDKVSRAAIAALCTVDADGTKLFSEQDVEALAKKHGGALERIVNAALSFNAMTEASLDEAKNA